MPEDDRKDATRDAVEREIDAALKEQVTGLPPDQAEALREKIRLRVRKEVERDLLARTASERRAAARLPGGGREKEKQGEEGELFQRFNRNFRFQHVVMFTAVILLIITTCWNRKFRLNRWNSSP